MTFSIPFQSVCPTPKQILTGYRFVRKMKFAERCAALLFLTTLNISLWLTAPLFYTFPNAEPGRAPPITGLGAEPWKVRSLQGVSEKHRASFEKFYNDDRRFFGNGQEKPIDLTHKTEPHDFSVVEAEQGKKLKKEIVQNIVSKMFSENDGLRKLDNLKRLLIAADLIKKQINVSSLTFKSVLQVKTGTMGIVEQIEQFGRSLQLTRNEKLFLMSAAPYIREEKEANIAAKKSPKFFVWKPKEDTE